jgi:predicted nucleic acid-binding protein
LELGDNADRSTIKIYYLYRKLKNEGSLLPDADLLIAEAVIAHDLKFGTNDASFLRLKPLGLRFVVNELRLKLISQVT